MMGLVLAPAGTGARPCLGTQSSVEMAPGFLSGNLGCSGFMI